MAERSPAAGAQVLWRPAPRKGVLWLIAGAVYLVGFLILAVLAIVWGGAGYSVGLLLLGVFGSGMCAGMGLGHLRSTFIVTGDRFFLRIPSRYLSDNTPWPLLQTVVGSREAITRLRVETFPRTGGSGLHTRWYLRYWIYIVPEGMHTADAYEVRDPGSPDRPQYAGLVQALAAWTGRSIEGASLLREQQSA